MCVTLDNSVYLSICVEAVKHIYLYYLSAFFTTAVERIQVSVERDCLKMCKLLQAHTGMSLSQIGNLAVREYMLKRITEDASFRALALAMETEPGSFADKKMKELRKTT